MKIQPVKGTRDLYPDEMAAISRLTDVWRKVSLRSGFAEFDGPVLEYLDLFRAKSGDEIVSQLFNFVDRGGRELALRPEITPTLARMVNARINSLPRPIKWFSIPRLFRAENPQKGRLREFLQWNVDIIGSDDVVADAECVFTAVDALAELGLGPEDVKVHYSSRRLLSAVLAVLGVGADAHPAVLTVLDKRGKVPQEAFVEMLAAVVPDAEARAGVLRFLEVGSPDPATVAAEAGLAATDEIAAAAEDLLGFRRALAAFGIGDWCVYDTAIVRGLAYYTGIVYEVLDAAGELRAIAGGGRYDNLLEALGGPEIGATGFGMGDAVLAILLKSKGRLPADAGRLDCFVAADGCDDGRLLAVVGRLRRAGVAVDFSPRRAGLGRQLKDANRRRARFAVILRPDGLAVKDMESGRQADADEGAFLAEPGRFLDRQGG